MRCAVALAITAFVVACAGEDAPRQRYSDDAGGYMVTYPDGWTVASARGTTRFVSSDAKRVIVLRSVVKPPEIVEGTASSDPDIYAATRRVLDSLSRAKVGEPSTIKHPTLRGARFSLTFTPIGRPPHRRVHVTLIGEKRVFHVIQATPKTETLDEKTLDLMVSSLREEL